MSVAVVILNWNGKHFLEKFIPLLLERTALASDGERSRDDGANAAAAVIFVADNGSTDGSVEWVGENCPAGTVRLITFDRNYGFTGGYNRAFAIIRDSGERFSYYLLLNSDVEVTPGWLDSLVRFMETHPRAGICAPKVLSYNARDCFEHAGACGGFMDRYYFPYCRGRVLSTVEKDNGQYDTPCETFWASGTSFMIRSSLWDSTGGLDDSFFAHMEEIDLCWRAKLAGWQVWSVPDSVIYHVGGGTLPNNSPRKLYLNFRNNLLMMYKNLPAGARGRIVFLRMCVDGCIACLYLLSGKWSFFKSVVRAHSDYRRMRKTARPTPQAFPVPRPEVTLFGLVLRRFV